MRKFVLRFATLAGVVLTLGACADSPTQPDRPAPDLAAQDVQAQGCVSDGGVCLLPPQTGGGGDACDPYEELDNSCDDDACMTSVPEHGRPGEPGRPSQPGRPSGATTQGCDGDGRGDAGGGGGGGGSGGGGGGGDSGTEPLCDPAIHPTCEQPLTDADTATINMVLKDFLRPASAFTDSTAARECAEMATWFRDALASGAVFRGEFDSDSTNDPYGSHYGMYSSTGGSIHFDPSYLDAANAGNVDAQREVAITALHEAAHRAGFSHPAGPTFDAQGRDYYTDPPFHRLNPGENSCVAR